MMSRYVPVPIPARVCSVPVVVAWKDYMRPRFFLTLYLSCFRLLESGEMQFDCLSIPLMVLHVQPTARPSLSTATAWS